MDTGSHGHCDLEERDVLIVGAESNLMRPVPAGIALATIAMVLFGVYHWFFVAPVAAVFIEGLVWAVGGGAALGWAYQRQFLDHGRSGPLWGLAFGTLFASTLVPYEAVGLLWGPFPDIGDAGDFFTALPLAFLGVPLALLIAWLLERRRRVGWSFVVAVLVIHFMIGGSIANFGGRGTTALLFWGFVALELLGGVWLGWLASPARREDPPRPDVADMQATPDSSNPRVSSAIAKERASGMGVEGPFHDVPPNEALERTRLARR